MGDTLKFQDNSLYLVLVSMSFWSSGTSNLSQRNIILQLLFQLRNWVQRKARQHANNRLLMSQSIYDLMKTGCVLYLPLIIPSHCMVFFQLLIDLHIIILFNLVKINHLQMIFLTLVQNKTMLLVKDIKTIKEISMHWLRSSNSLFAAEKIVLSLFWIYKNFS